MEYKKLYGAKILKKAQWRVETKTFGNVLFVWNYVVIKRMNMLGRVSQVKKIGLEVML